MTCKNKSSTGIVANIGDLLGLPNSSPQQGGLVATFTGFGPSDTGQKYSLPVYNVNFGNSFNKLYSGKKNVYIEKETFGPTVADRKRGVITFSDGTTIPDRFRLAEFKYWTYDQNGDLVYSSEIPTLLKDRILDYDYDSSKSKRQYFSTTNKFTGSVGELVSEQWILLESSTGEQNWKSYLQTIPVNVPLYDHTFGIDTPFFFNEKSERIGKCFVKYSGEYNYFLKEQEEIPKEVSVSSFPNLYLESLLDETGLPSANRILYSNIDTFNGAVSLPTRGSSKSEYLKKRARASRMAAGTTANYWFAHSDSETLLRNNEKEKYMYPMYLDLSFSIDGKSEVSRVLKLTKFGDVVTKKIIQSKTSPVGTSKKEFVEIKQISQGTNISSQFTKTSLKSWDLNVWISEYLATTNTETVGIPVTKEDLTSSSLIVDQLKSLLGTIYFGKIKTLCKSKMRSYYDMLNGKICYSDTILYRIEKLRSDEFGNAIGQSIQEYYIPSNGGGVLDFIDTQMRYGEDYRYNVYAYQVVVGTKYEYSDLVSKGSCAVFKVKQEPSLLLTEVPYFSFSTSVVDDPPARPDVRIIPYKGINNKLLFLFNGGVEKTEEYPVKYGPEQEKSLLAWYRSKSIMPGEKIVFKSDDPVKVFQIFRTDAKPKQLGDFNGKLVTSLRTDVLENTPQEASSAAFVDRLVANKVYWYMFRSVDRHGHYSQPSDVWEVVLKEDVAGGVFLEYRTFKMEEENKRYDESARIKGMRKLLYIVPNMAQVQINEEKGDVRGANSALNVNNVFLGNAEEGSIWGGLFKVRLTSKSSGKKIDLNLHWEYQKKN
jgi:hypothetical protein